jgi:hypothetical protein
MRGKILYILFFLTLMKTSAAVKLEKVSYGGWSNCLKLSNGQIELIATTDVGPRIINLSFVGGKNFMKEFPEHMGKSGGDQWRSYGGHRFWHAPEIRPRTYAPDNEPLAYHWDKKTLKLVQSVEVSTGLQKEIHVTLDAKTNRVTVLHRLTNKNHWAVEAAPWALTVMGGPGRAIFPQEPVVNQLLPVRALALWGYTDMRDSRWIWGTKYIQVKCDPKATTPQKFGAMNTLGWGAYYRDGELFLKKFPFDVKATYPDFGCNTECYTRGDMLEVESLGALQKLEPGQTIEHVETWILAKIELDENEETISKKLAPLLK